jgi:hypothetical protein
VELRTIEQGAELCLVRVLCVVARKGQRVLDVVGSDTEFALRRCLAKLKLNWCLTKLKRRLAALKWRHAALKWCQPTVLTVRAVLRVVALLHLAALRFIDERRASVGNEQLEMKEEWRTCGAEE